MQVCSLHVYPIKSCGGVSLSSMTLCEKGPLYDREWMIVKPNGDFITARKYPSMLTISLSFTEDKKFFEVTLPECKNKLYLPIDPSKAPLVSESPPNIDTKDLGPVNEKNVRIWGAKCLGEDLGEECASFFGDFLSCEVRFVRSSSRVAPRKLTDDKGSLLFILSEDDLVSYADGFPYLLTCTASLDDLNKRIGSETLPMRRFRSNIVISGAQAWQEDTMKTIKIGNAIFDGAKSCSRCKMTTIDQNSGSFASKEPLQTLQTFRRSVPHPEISSTGLMFGRNLIQVIENDNTSIISVGDPLTITKATEALPHIPKN